MKQNIETKFEKVSDAIRTILSLSLCLGVLAGGVTVAMKGNPLTVTRTVKIVETPKLKTIATTGQIAGHRLTVIASQSNGDITSAAGVLGSVRLHATALNPTNSAQDRLWALQNIAKAAGVVGNVTARDLAGYEVAK